MAATKSATAPAPAADTPPTVDPVSANADTPPPATADKTPAPEAPKASGAFEYTGPTEVVYLAVPLTARPYRAAIPADGDNPAIPEQPATVYAWPDGAPDDGRWTPTDKTPNQAADNQPQPGANPEE